VDAGVPGGDDNRGVGELPSGTVTMLFSDIEGSTALLGRLGDRYGRALSDHRVLLRAAFAAWDGREMSTEGDSFFAVFESASDAVACAMAAQRALAGHDWPGGEVVRVRMGLHSGQPTEHDCRPRSPPSSATRCERPAWRVPRKASGSGGAYGELIWMPPRWRGTWRQPGPP
jgi:class 3 adenylate cyclase